ncbi:type II toxin-antitoxin system VapB family antitoxin [Millisia brevis]|uniref:type II toxin-antitoxin system VapB family antitoxin n=1 Tax=Millisia brevis TaxID=264148 RepID=UPI000831E903|nr:type II toxin-antitoxin system VapB family antitoxin [Millisia brevis]
MALNIKDPETDRLARELAQLTGKPITTALREAIEEKLAALRARQSAVTAAGLEAIIARGRARATIDDRSADTILGYDDRGLPA